MICRAKQEIDRIINGAVEVFLTQYGVKVSR